MDEAPQTTDAAELEHQYQAAADALRATVLRLLQEGEIDPQLLVLAVARVTGELGSSAALASGMSVEAVLGDLAEVVRDTGQDHAEALRAVELPVMGSA
jgi:hypothetical protein